MNEKREREAAQELGRKYLTLEKKPAFMEAKCTCSDEHKQSLGTGHEDGCQERLEWVKWLRGNLTETEHEMVFGEAK